MMIEVRELQKEKALFLILVTPSGMVIEVNEEQLLNVHDSIDVILFGRVIEVREVQPSKIETPI